MKKNIVRVLTVCLTIFAIAGCAKKENSKDATVEAQSDQQVTDETVASETQTGDNENTSESVYIIYTNDIHSHIYNVVTDEATKEEKPGLRLSNVAALVNDMREEGKDVILVDAGDEFQGDVYGAFDEGESVVKLMNASGYQLATPGNHDFDYGMNTFFNRIEEANYPYISCNFHALVGDGDPMDAYKIFEIGGKKIAFIGITTPETITSSTPTYFQNEKGEYIYAIDGTDKPEALYESVQKTIDEARADADYVIALAHVGVGLEEKRNKISSYDVIENTEGLDAYIDAHSHTLIDSEPVKDKNGEDVLLTQTGSYLANIGIMEINGDEITASLIDSYDNTDSQVAEMEDEIYTRIMDKMGEKIADLGTTLYIYDPDNKNRRLIRSREMNSGDFTADAIYWYFNDTVDIDCDIAIANGGGIREQLNDGDITYMDVKSVEPFGNMICLIKATGQQILDALELGATVTGEWDSEWDIPAENGGFLQVAGMQYTIDSTVPSSVETSEDGMFKSVNGEYRVKDVKVYNKETASYEPLDVNKTYSLGGINYILRNSGNGMSMFADDDLIVDYVGQDYVILSQYCMSFDKAGDYALVKSENSPLKKLPGYLLDYENPYGAGRINIILNDK